MKGQAASEAMGHCCSSQQFYQAWHGGDGHAKRH
jgi:hypothetical protein